MRTKDVLGRWGEDLAVTHLTTAGLEIIDRNWRMPGGGGELDVVAWDGDVLVFAEVKTRTSTAFGHPAEAMTPPKTARIHRLATAWLIANGKDVRVAARRSWRFDVIAVTRLGADGPDVSHLRGAF
jgi:putative endonuclease